MRPLFPIVQQRGHPTLVDAGGKRSTIITRHNGTGRCILCSLGREAKLSRGSMGTDLSGVCHVLFLLPSFSSRNLRRPLDFRQRSE